LTDLAGKCAPKFLHKFTPLLNSLGRFFAQVYKNFTADRKKEEEEKK
jgi:hypothetical protein